MNNILGLLSSAKSFRIIGNADISKISDYEKELEIVFAKDYTVYLLEYGCASIYGHEFTGMTDDQRLNVVTVTKFVRSLFDSFPHDYYVIESTNDIFYCQDFSGKIYAVNHNGFIELVYDDLYSYLLDCIVNNGE